MSVVERRLFCTNFNTFATVMRCGKIQNSKINTNARVPSIRCMDVFDECFDNTFIPYATMDFNCISRDSNYNIKRQLRAAQIAQNKGHSFFFVTCKCVRKLSFFVVVHLLAIHVHNLFDLDVLICSIHNETQMWTIYPTKNDGLFQIVHSDVYY